MTTRAVRKLILFSLLPLTAASSQAQDPLSKFLRVNSYTPVPDHQSDLVPGMLLVVNWKTGEHAFKDPLDDALALHLMPPSTEQLSKLGSIRVTSADAATSGLKAIIGFDASVQFANNGSFTFSGVKFNVQRLNSNDVDKLLVSGATKEKAEQLLNHSGPLDVFLVVEVDSTKSVSITSSSTIQFAAGTSASTLTTCSAPAPNLDAAPPAAGAATPGAAPAAANDSGSKTQTVAQAKTATSAADTQAKTAAAGASELGGTLQLCHGTGTSDTFVSDSIVPSAIKVVRLYSPSGTDVKMIQGDAAVPFDEPAKLRRLLQNHPSNMYDIPKSM